MRPSQLKEEDLFDSASMSNSTWSIQAQKDSKKYCVKFHFLSEKDGSDTRSLSTVEISKTCGNTDIRQEVFM